MTATALAAPAVAVTVLAGVWVAGGASSAEYRTSMALPAAWCAISGADCEAIARRRRALRNPVHAAVVLTAGATGAYLGATQLRDCVDDAELISAAPAPAPATPAER
jgi:hypothetical protein